VFTYDQTCMTTNVIGNASVDADTPLPGELFYYHFEPVVKFGDRQRSIQQQGPDATLMRRSGPRVSCVGFRGLGVD